MLPPFSALVALEKAWPDAGATPKQPIIGSIKDDLRNALPEVKSSHRIEALARGLGWATNAAMRASLK